MEMISTPQQKAIPPVAILIVIMAGLNIFSIVYLKNIKAQKINGIYKCIGYTTWHLIHSNLCYVVVIAMVSIGITYPASYYMYSPLMKLSLSMLNFKEYPMQFNTSHIIMADIAVLIIFIISTVASSKALFKVNARDLVQE
jgi:ABC-type antimicrobial peptide transport system permease subunit